MPTATARPEWQIARDAADADALAAFADDRYWNGYSIADLTPALRQWTRVAIARDGDGATAACLFYRHPHFNSTIPHGDPAGVAAILAAAAAREELPGATYILTRPAHLPILADYYDFSPGQTEMIRMAVDGDRFVPPPGPGPVRRLGEGDVPALFELYADYAASAFTPDQLTQGIFYGAHDDGRLVAAGGTHVVAPAFGLAAVGNVYTAPGARGRGLGAAVAAAVTADLLAAGCRDVILNVAAANDGARRIYRRLGFVEHCRYVETSAIRKEGGGR